MMNIATLKQKTMISGMDIAGIGLTVFAGVELSDFIGDSCCGCWCLGLRLCNQSQKEG